MKYNKPWHSEWYKAKLCLWYICDFLRESDAMGEWGRSIKEIRLIEFQQWVGNKIPTEEDEEMYREPFSTNVNTINSRNKKLKKLMSKEDYEEHLRQMRELVKKNNEKKF